VPHANLYGRPPCKAHISAQLQVHNHAYMQKPEPCKLNTFIDRVIDVMRAGTFDRDLLIRITQPRPATTPIASLIELSLRTAQLDRGN
jgi:hypothetical protein